MVLFYGNSLSHLIILPVPFDLLYLTPFLPIYGPTCITNDWFFPPPPSIVHTLDLFVLVWRLVWSALVGPIFAPPRIHWSFIIPFVSSTVYFYNPFYIDRYHHNHWWWISSGDYHISFSHDWSRDSKKLSCHSESDFGNLSGHSSLCSSINFNSWHKYSVLTHL